MSERTDAIAERVQNRLAGALKQAGMNDTLTDGQIDDHAEVLAQQFATDSATRYSSAVVAELAGESDE